MTTTIQYDVYHYETSWGDEMFKNRVCSFTTEEAAEKFRDELVEELKKHNPDEHYSLYIDTRVVTTDVEPTSFRPVMEVEAHGTLYLPEQEASVETYSPAELRILSVRDDAVKTLIAGEKGWAVTYWDGVTERHFTDPELAIAAVIAHEEVLEGCLDFTLNLFTNKTEGINQACEELRAALAPYAAKLVEQ